MKKFLTLLLVLCLSSTASALTVSLTSGGSSTITAAVDDVITVDLKADFATTGYYEIDFIAGGASAPTISAVGAWVSPMTLMEVAGTLSGGDIINASSNVNPAVVPEIAAGTIVYTFSATVTGLGTLTPLVSSADYVYIKNSPYYYTGASITQTGLNIVPEPMTIALLGLGGLFLRRRR